MVKYGEITFGHHFSPGFMENLTKKTFWIIMFSSFWSLSQWIGFSGESYFGNPWDFSHRNQKGEFLRLVGTEVGHGVNRIPGNFSAGLDCCGDFRIPLIAILPTLATHISHINPHENLWRSFLDTISFYIQSSKYIRSKTYPNIHIFDSFDDIFGYDALPSYFGNGIDSKIFRAGDNMGERGIRITSDN